jgi:enoyl-CoA hydratase/carnithine racemase
MMNEFVPLFDHLQNDDKVKGIVVISAKPGSFIAGADIKLDKKKKSFFNHFFLLIYLYSMLARTRYNESN